MDADDSLVKAFPGSEVYVLRNSEDPQTRDVVIFSRDAHIFLAGQETTTRYGTYTLLTTQGYDRGKAYTLIDPLIITKRLDRGYRPRSILSADEMRRRLDHLLSLQGYKVDGKDIAGYADMSGNAYSDDIMRIIATIIAMGEGRIKSKDVIAGEVILSAYEPRPQSFISVQGFSREINSIMKLFEVNTFDKDKYFTYAGRGPTGGENYISKFKNDKLGNYLQILLNDTQLKLSETFYSAEPEYWIFNDFSSGKVVNRIFWLMITIAEVTRDSDFLIFGPNVRPNELDLERYTGTGFEGLADGFAPRSYPVPLLADNIVEIDAASFK